MDASKLPGTPLSLALRCPGCGWGFDLGLRDLGMQVDMPSERDQHYGFTVCSKCLAGIEFDMRDGSGARVMTPQRFNELPPGAQRLVIAGRYLAWVASCIEAAQRPLQ